MKHILRETHFPASPSRSHLEQQTVPAVIGITELHSLVRGWGKCSSPTAHLCFNNKNIGKMVTEYQLPFPLPPSIIREMITDLFPEASKDAYIRHEIFIWKSHQQSADDPWSKTLCNCKGIQYRSQTVYMWVGESVTETKLDCSWK